MELAGLKVTELDIARAVSSVTLIAAELPEKYFPTIQLRQDEAIPEKFTGIIRFSNRKEYFFEGRLHRADGFAVERDDCTGQYWLMGIYFPEWEWAEVNYG